MANIKSIGGNPIVLGMDGLDDEVKGNLTSSGGYSDLLTAGAADGIKGGGPTVDGTFLHRVTGGGQASDGPATIEVVRGNTLVWNQLYHKNVESATVRGIAYTIDANGLITLNGTVAQTGYILGYVVPVTVGHKYLACGHGGNFDGSKVTFELQVSGGVDLTNSGLILTVAAGTTQFAPAICLKNLGDTLTNVTFRPQLFDLTQMFGAGNEPSTVAEFEALFPEPYYEYDAGSLLSVNMEGIETVGFNLWDEEWESGQFNTTTGEKVAASDRIRSKNYIPVIPSTAYYFECSTTSNAFTVCYYDADKGFIGAAYPSMNSVVTTPANARYLMFTPPVAYGTTYNHDICINLSWSGRRNGEYEAFWKSQRLIGVASYFPDGMRSAGSVYDELTSTEAITRIKEMTGAELAELQFGNITRYQDNFTSDNGIVSFRITKSKTPDLLNSVTNVAKASLTNVVGMTTIWNRTDIPSGCIAIGWVDGIIVSGHYSLFGLSEWSTSATIPSTHALYAASTKYHFVLATPTVTPIDPALNLSYRAEQSGTETVLVPTGEMSAPVPMVVVYGSTSDGILDRSASLLAAMDGPTATANHAIGSYLTMDGTLYRVTTAIASGEAIVPGTNVTATTVMAEVLSLIQ